MSFKLQVQAAFLSMEIAIVLIACHFMKEMNVWRL